jgi:hypothetical protein
MVKDNKFGTEVTMKKKGIERLYEFVELEERKI